MASQEDVACTAIHGRLSDELSHFRLCVQAASVRGGKPRFRHGFDAREPDQQRRSRKAPVSGDSPTRNPPLSGEACEFVCRDPEQLRGFLELENLRR